jgi:hypothetical protein
VRSPGFIQFSVLVAGATTSLHKVRNFRGEQKVLERTAIDCESQVREVSETLLLLAGGIYPASVVE